MPRSEKGLKKERTFYLRIFSFIKKSKKMFNFSHSYKRCKKHSDKTDKTSGSGNFPRELFESKRKSKTSELVDEFCEFFVSLKIFLERQYNVSEKWETNWHLGAPISPSSLQCSCRLQKYRLSRKKNYFSLLDAWKKTKT